MWLKFEPDKEYLTAAFRSIRAYIGLGFLIIGLLEQWRNMHVLIPHWAMITIGVLLVMLAQFEAFKKNYQELQRTRNDQKNILQREMATLEKQHSENLAKKDVVIEQKERELSELKGRISQVPFSLQVEIDRAAPLVPVWARSETFGGGGKGEVIHVPRVILALRKKPQSQDLEVSITQYSLDHLRTPGHPPEFLCRRLIRDTEEVDITEKLVRFIGGDPFNRDRLLLFEQDVIALLRYEVLSVPGETATSFRVKGKLNANTLQLEVEQLPTPPRSTSGR